MPEQNDTSQNNKSENPTSETESKSAIEAQSPTETSSTNDDGSTQAAIETYEQTADSDGNSTTYSAQGVTTDTSPAHDNGVQVAPATINSPLQAVKAIILKPNPVFAKLKGTGNWSWIPFIIVAFCSALPSWLYFNSVDMNWYTDLMVQTELADVSPAEQANMKQMMMLQDDLGSYTAIVTIIGLVLMYGIFALYLHKITQIDEDNVLSYGDWYGFMWWISIPFAVFSLITAGIIVLHGGPEIPPEILSPFSLASLLGLSISSDWFGWAQGIGPDMVWSIYLMTVGVSQWTKLNSRQCLIIASAPFAIIWGLWAVSIVL